MQIKNRLRSFLINLFSKAYFKRYPKDFNDLAESVIEKQMGMLKECAMECRKENVDLIVVLDGSTLPLTLTAYGGSASDVPKLSLIKGDDDNVH